MTIQIKIIIIQTPCNANQILFLHFLHRGGKVTLSLNALKVSLFKESSFLNDMDFRLKHCEISLWCAKAMTLDRTSHNNANTLGSDASCVHTHTVHSHKILYWNINTNTHTVDCVCSAYMHLKETCYEYIPPLDLFLFLFLIHIALFPKLPSCSCAQRRWFEGYKSLKTLEKCRQYLL